MTDTPPFKEVATGLRFPEGPVALKDGSVLVVEIRANCLTRVYPDGRKQVVATPGGGPNGAAIGPDGKCYICNNGGFEFADEPCTRPVRQADNYTGGRIERIDLETGAVETLFTHTPDVKLRGPNDIVFDRQGGFWFSDLGKTRPREMDRGGVYYVAPDGKTIREVIYPMTMANGVGLSPDDGTLYVAETDSGRLWAFEITGPGEVKKLPFPSPHGGRLLVGLPGMQRLDSMAVEENGNICVATLFDHPGITVVSPDGKLVEQVPFPDPYVTNICFGGEDMRTAYITLSGSGRLIATQWKRPGLKLYHLQR